MTEIMEILEFIGQAHGWTKPFWPIREVVEREVDDPTEIGQFNRLSLEDDVPPDTHNM